MGYYCCIIATTVPLFLELLLFYNQVIVYYCHATRSGVDSHFLEKSPTFGINFKIQPI